MNTIEFKPCLPEYWEFVRRLRNHPDVQQGFVDSANISLEQQWAFMEKNSTWYTIAVQGGDPVGYLGLIGASRTEITLCVEPMHHGRGIGSALLQFAHENIQGAWAKVLLTNAASLKAVGRIFSCTCSVGEFQVFAKDEIDLQRGVLEIEKES